MFLFQSDVQYINETQVPQGSINVVNVVRAGFFVLSVGGCLGDIVNVKVEVVGVAVLVLWRFFQTKTLERFFDVLDDNLTDFKNLKVLCPEKKFT